MKKFCYLAVLVAGLIAYGCSLTNNGYPTRIVVPASGDTVLLTHNKGWYLSYEKDGSIENIEPVTDEPGLLVYRIDWLELRWRPDAAYDSLFVSPNKSGSTRKLYLESSPGGTGSDIHIDIIQQK
ncbi:MAG: hypothetical protein K2F63_03520 [Muribaculaceae bacterium]|nr:hypothetical protein [Muribaculaceae bacterium]MDE6134699.1 hypothetical protein [Muribaculaceae bacterium]